MLIVELLFQLVAKSSATGKDRNDIYAYTHTYKRRF